MPTWGPSGADVQNCMGPIWVARAGPKWQPIKNPHGAHMEILAGVLHAEIVVLLTKDAIEPVPPAEMKSGFFSLYFIVPKKGSGL